MAKPPKPAVKPGDDSQERRNFFTKVAAVAIGGFVAVAAVVGGALVINGIRKAAPAPPTPRPVPAQTTPAPIQTAPVTTPPSQAPPAKPAPTAPEPEVKTGPAVELPPLPSEPAPAQLPAQPSQTAQEPAEGSEPPKNPFDAAKDAADKYVSELEESSKVFDAIKERLEKDTQLSPETRDAIIKQLKAFTDTTEKARELVNSVDEQAKNLADFRDKIKSLKREMKELAETHTQTLKDLKDLPQGPAQAFADLAVVIDAAGRGAEALVGKIGGGKAVKAFEIKESVQQGIKGTGKAVKVWHTSDIEAKDLSQGEKNPIPTYEGEKGLTDEIIQIQNKGRENQPPGFIDKAKKWLDWLAGEKYVDPSQLKFR